MKILKTDKILIDEGYRYKIDGHLISKDSLDLSDLDKPLYVTGSIEAGESIEAGGSIEAGWSIEAGGFIKAGEYIEAGESIEAGGFIKASRYIKAGWRIEAGEYIEAGEFFGIVAGLSIIAKTTISAGLTILAGVCVWRKITDEDKTITCTKLTGGATVEYGILNIVKSEESEVESNSDDIITLNGKKYKLIGG